MTAIEKLDKVLNIFYNSDRKGGFDYAELFKATSHLLEYKDELNKIIKKLRKDELIYIEDITASHDFVRAEVYFLTIEGMIFVENKGYGQQNKNAKIKRNRDIANAQAVGIGTALAGLYALWEIVKSILLYIFHCK